jgi:hypothetical protein
MLGTHKKQSYLLTLIKYKKKGFSQHTIVIAFSCLLTIFACKYKKYVMLHNNISVHYIIYTIFNASDACEFLKNYCTHSQNHRLSNENFWSHVCFFRGRGDGWCWPPCTDNSCSRRKSSDVQSWSAGEDATENIYAHEYKYT